MDPNKLKLLASIGKFSVGSMIKNEIKSVFKETEGIDMKENVGVLSKKSREATGL